ncbi:putative zinc metalloprotease [Scheffersomyces xylosifermentans]|uniref:putative zinc metalloprotease n=1 Tax=Scheffersomyces xylosifermentans TaxID=1304137 RepID=UPI00315D74C7
MSEPESSALPQNGSVPAATSSPALNKQTPHGDHPSESTAETPKKSNSLPNILLIFIRATFGYRKTSLSLLVFLTYLVVVVLSYIDNSLDYTTLLPTTPTERSVLRKSWLDLQNIGKQEHTYGSSGNDFVHHYLEQQILGEVTKKKYIEYDNDLNGNNTILYGARSGDFNSVSYYESNNLVVRINGSNSELPALLVSSHFDSVPSSFGVTDDGMGVATLLGILYYYAIKTTAQPERTIVLNFNNNEEFGLYGATAFLSHPWSKNVRYFLNLEGTGAGGRPILFRGTDYGIVKHFAGVRYPYGTSIFQEGFNNHLIHSETDYKVYKESGGLRGLDLAFYKPRDLYHTAGDNIKNVSPKSLYLMLATSLDFTNIITKGPIDLDNEYLGEDLQGNTSTDFAIYASFLNYFFSIPVTDFFVFSIGLLVIVPLASLPLLLVIFGYKKNWQLSFVNVIKLPLSVVSSAIVLHILTETIVVNLNEFLPNNSPLSIVFILFAVFLFLNYFILNGINLLFLRYKIVNHDEKLIAIIETSFLYWVILLWSTIKLANNKIGDDHTGEYPFILLSALQAFAALVGLIGWGVKPPRRRVKKITSHEAQPLLNNREQHYGSHDLEVERVVSGSSSLSLNLEPEEVDVKVKEYIKTFSYDWSLQFLTIVPLSTYLIYNSGYLIVDGINKSIQESLIAEKFIFKLLQLFAIALTIPLLPFVYKLNRLVVYGLVGFSAVGFLFIASVEPFDQKNPLKVRFIQKVDLDNSTTSSYVSVLGRVGSPLSHVLADIPSVKESGKLPVCEPLTDGNQACTYKSALPPYFVPEATSFSDYLHVDVLKNSSSSNPFGLLTGEIQIKTPKNRQCTLNFKSSQSSKRHKEAPVKTVIIFNKSKPNNDTKVFSSDISASGIPEGFSRDKDGSFIFKDLSGIDQLQLNKLDWDKPYHLAFQWVPNFADSEFEESDSKKLDVSIQCFWSDLTHLSDEDGTVRSSIPAYEELLHFSPNYVSIANWDKGLVSVSKAVQI